MERETVRSIAAWLLLASAHQEPVPSHVTAAGSWAQVTRPGTTPRGTPSGESVDPNKEERMLLAAAIERAKCRRVIFICGYSFSINHVFRDAIEGLETRVCLSLREDLSGTTMVVRPRGAVGDARQVPIVISTNDSHLVPSNSATASAAGPQMIATRSIPLYALLLYQFPCCNWYKFRRAFQLHDGFCSQ